MPLLRYGDDHAMEAHTLDPAISKRWCLPLGDAADPAQAGNKAATLAWLRAHGLLVPDGFCITTDAFAAACAASGITPDAPPEHPVLVMPDDVRAAIVQAYHALGDGLVAVRSSAIAEDLAGASFAGQYETVLNVEGDEAVVAAVVRCWASAFGARARAYATGQEAGSGKREAGTASASPAPLSLLPAAQRGRMAVLVQRMVPAECAGVVFTQSPQPGHQHELVIEAAPGLGEAVVSARVTPDRYVLQRSPLLLREIVVSPDRGPAARPVLNAAALRLLAETALRVERLAGAPQDIEWAAVPGDLYLLQARPISTRSNPDPAPFPTAVAEGRDASTAGEGHGEGNTDAGSLPPIPKGKPYDVWSRANTGEVFPGVVSPLTWSAIAAAFRDVTTSIARRLGVPPDEVGDLFGLFYGRVYTNVGVLHHLMTEVLGFSSNSFEGSLGGPGRMEGLPLPRQPVRWHKVIRFLPVMLHDLLSVARLQARADEIMDQARAFDLRLRARDLSAMSLDELRQTVREIAAATGPGWVFHTQCAGAAFEAYGMLGGLLRRWAGDRTLANDLVTGLATLTTTQIAEELWRVARRAAVDPATARLVADADAAALPAALQRTEAGRAAWADLQRFLDHYGHRGHDELDVMTPRWADDPRPVFAVFKGYVAAGPEHDPSTFAERQRHKREEAERAIDRLLSRGVERWLPVRRWVFHVLLDRARSLMPLRENIKHELLRLTLHLRRTLLEIGRRLTADGLLNAPDDVFFAEVGELEALLASSRFAPIVRRRIMQRQRQRAAWVAMEPPALIVPGAPSPPRSREHAPAPASASGAVLTGLGASAGRATGPARVLHSPAEADQMQPGEVLVAPFTDPGWTPVFPLAAGIVMDLGGLLSHGAIVAREYGIPAVVNVREGTARIRTGQTVTVDGTRGLVLLDGGG